jgi:hypothetical protein
MGVAAYNRGSRAISRALDRDAEELREKRRSGAVRCGGTFRNGPEKKYGRCDRCGRIDYEKYEGDNHP